MSYADRGYHEQEAGDSGFERQGRQTRGPAARPHRPSAEGSLLDSRLWPALLIGTGLVWLTLGTGRGRAVAAETGEWVQRQTDPLAGRARRTWHGLATQVSDGVDSLRRAATGMKEEADPIAGNYDRIADHDSRHDPDVTGYGPVVPPAATGRSAGGAGAGGAAGGGGIGHGLRDLLAEHPLAVGLMGIALGAAIGASLPGTPVEDRWLGRRSDNLTDRLREEGQEMVDQASTSLREAAQDLANPRPAEPDQPAPARTVPPM